MALDISKIDQMIDTYERAIAAAIEKKSYTIGDRSFTSQDLGVLNTQYLFWLNEKTKFEAVQSGRRSRYSLARFMQ